MKKLTTAAILVGGAIMASQTASAFTYDDLYFGLTNPNGTEDYIFNLGAASSMTGYGDFTSFGLSGLSSGLLGSNSSTVAAGVVGGNQYTPDIYYTVMRSSLGVPGVAGSTTPNPLYNPEGAVSALTGIVAPVVGIGVADTGRSWAGQVVNPLVNSSFSANAYNPDSLINLGGVLYEDLYYQNQDGATPSYLGYFTLDYTSDTYGDLTFNAVPEPASYALAGFGGLLLLALRRRSTGKNASFSPAQTNKN